LNNQQHEQQQQQILVWKQPKIVVEEDIYMDGTTPKVIIPKELLFDNNYGTSTTIRTG
jgi:hypothetical protein